MLTRLMRSLTLCVFIWLLLPVQPLLAATYTANDDVIGTIGHYTVRKKDNLFAIARHFDIGIVELLAANPGISQTSLKSGKELKITTMHVLPETREGIVLNLSELRLFYFVDNTVMTFPVTIGREGWETPVGTTTLVKKRKDPVWIPPELIREEDPNLPEIIPAGPNNPLGAYALNLGWPSYAIHGTNRPYGLGKRASHGCIRLYPEDIEVLFNAVDVGTPVTVIDMPYKLGWQGNKLFLEVTPTQLQSDAIAQYRQPAPVSIADIYDAIRQIGGVEINWQAVDETAAERSGLPVMIGE
jgi:L,D-transpeptidase ErfK/SrfK